MAAYTNIDDPSAHFTTTLHTGDGTSPKSITNSANSGDFQPDLIWAKGRSTAYEHQLSDSSRGTSSSNGLASNTSNAEGFFSSTYGYVSSFDSNGFTATAGSAGGPPYYHNASGTTYAFWQWKANGGTTSSNTNGTITSTVQVNSDAGFSIVTFTSPSSGSFSVGHGLGVKPDMVITKSLNGTSDWWTWHKGLTNDTTYYLDLSATSAEGSISNMWGSTGITSSVFGMNYPASAYANRNYVAYCFASKQGYSKIGTYVGNGSTTNGPFVYTGFKPAFVMIKAVDAAKNWVMVDNKRIVVNGDVYLLYANTNGAEVQSPSSGGHIDLLSNGFKFYDNYSLTNQSSVNYAYIAFAENPFVTSTGIPATAR